MIFRSGLALLLLGALLPQPRSSRSALTTPNGCVVSQGLTSTRDLVQTCSLLQAYVGAYNRHDRRAALALLDPMVRIWDCDLVWNQVHKIDGRTAASQWLRDRFAEHDRFQGPIAVGGWGASEDQASPLVFSFAGSRSSDVLTARGVPPYDLSGSKGVLIDAGTRILAMTLGDSTNCARYPFPTGASAQRTRAVVQAFVNAYDAHDLPRVLQTLTRDVSYRDRDYVHHTTSTLTGKAATRRWVQARFRAGDSLSQARITIPDPAQPSVAVVEAQRIVGPRDPRGTISVRLKIRLGGPHCDRIRAVALDAH